MKMNKFEKLYDEQDIILNLISKNNIELFLSGGTALHRFHFKDTFRYSEDLDLFLIDNQNTAEFDKFFSSLSMSKIPYKISVNANHFKQLEVLSGLKIELICDIALKKANITNQQGIWIDSIDNILANKLECIYSRDEPRDCFDIYTILQNSQVDIDKAFDTLISRTNILPEEIIDRLVKYPISFLAKEKILTKNENIYNDFIKNYKAIFTKSFHIPTITQESKSKTKRKR